MQCGDLLYIQSVLTCKLTAYGVVIMRQTSSDSISMISAIQILNQVLEWLKIGTYIDLLTPVEDFAWLPVQQRQTL